MTEKKIPDAVFAREAARTSAGKFGTQPRSEADLDLDVVRAALPAGPEATYDRFTYADLSAFTDRLDDPEFFQDPDTYEARVRISVLSSAYADRDRGTNSDAAREVLALYDVPGGLLEGRSLELQSAIDRDLFGYPSGYQVVDRDGRGTGRTTLREQHRTMMAALLENHLRFDAPAPMGDPRDLNIHPDQYQDEEMNAAELAEVHRRLSVSRNFSAENTDEAIGKVRKATRGMSLRQVHANDGQATKLTEELTEAGVTNAAPVLSVAGDPTGQVRATTRGGRTLIVSDHGLEGPAGYRQHRYHDRIHGLCQEIRLAATADVLRDIRVGDKTLHDAAVRDREFENGDGIGYVAAGEQLNPRDWYSGPEESDTLLVKMRITDTEEALVQRVLVTEGGFELEDYRGFPEMGHGLLAGRDRAKGLPVGTHAEALRQAHTRLAKDPDVTL